MFYGPIACVLGFALLILISFYGSKSLFRRRRGGILLYGTAAVSRAGRNILWFRRRGVTFYVNDITLAGEISHLGEEIRQ